MLKQILSVSDVKKLIIGDQLLDHSDTTLGKTYTVCNVSERLVYAISGDHALELKILYTNEIPQTNWWVLVYDHSEHNRSQL
jgi:hypothetical protein